MKHAAAWLAGLALSTLPLTPLIAGNTDMTDAKSQIHAAVETMTAALMRGDIDAVMGAYEPQAAVVFEPGTPVADVAHLRAGFQMFAGFNPTFTYPKGHEVFVAGDTGLHIAPWQMTGTGPDGAVIEQSGLSVAVFRRQEDDTWKMVLDNPHGGALLQ